MSSHRTVWLNGAFIPENEAYISPFDRGFLAGDGCCETLVTYYLTPFAFTRHDARLRAGLEALGIQGCPDPHELLKASKQLVMMNKLADPVCVRIMVTAGKAGIGFERADAPPTCLIAVLPAPSSREEEKVCVSRCFKPEGEGISGLKTISSASDVAAMRYARSQGTGEAISINARGMVCGGVESNIFWVQDGTVYTPALSTGAIPGVTRALVMELCGKLGFPVEEVEAPMSILELIKEAFLTSTLREVQPIVGIGDRRLLPGAYTLRLRKAYKDLTEDEVDP